MLEVFVICAFIGLAAIIDYAYRSGLINAGDIRQETRTSVFIDLCAINLSAGCIVGVFIIRVASIQGELTRMIVLAVVAAAFVLTVSLRAPVLAWLGLYWKRIGLGFASLAAIYCLALAVSAIRHPGWYRSHNGPAALDQSKAVPIK